MKSNELVHLRDMQNLDLEANPWYRVNAYGRRLSNRLGPTVARLLAAEHARFVLPLHESRYKGDLRPRSAVIAAINFALGLVDKKTLFAARAKCSSATRVITSGGTFWYAVTKFGDGSADFVSAYVCKSASRSAHNPCDPEGSACLAENAVGWEGNEFALIAQRNWSQSALRGALGDDVKWQPEWRTDTARAVAWSILKSQDLSGAPILADALQDAGCDNEMVLNRLRGLTHGAVLTLADVALWQTVDLAKVKQRA